MIQTVNQETAVLLQARLNKDLTVQVLLLLALLLVEMQRDLRVKNAMTATQP